MNTPFQYGPTPTDLGERDAYEGVSIPISRLLERTIAAGKDGQLNGLTFRRCMIHGPGVIIPDGNTRFVRCDLGDVRGDIRNLFLIAAGPMITGGVFLKGCVFEDCRIRGVGFVGDRNYVDNMVRELTARGSAQ